MHLLLKHGSSKDGIQHAIAGEEGCREEQRGRAADKGKKGLATNDLVCQRLHHSDYVQLRQRLQAYFTLKHGFSKDKVTNNIADRFVMQTATKGSTKQMWHLNRTEDNSDDDLEELRAKQRAEKRKA